MNGLVYDIETNKGDDFASLEGFDHVHCIVTQDLATGVQRRYHDDRTLPCEGNIQDGLDALMAAPLRVGHNVTFFDEPVLRRVFPDYTPIGVVRDTEVTAHLLWSDIKERDFMTLKKRAARGHPSALLPKYVGQHKLAAWGCRLGLLKDTDFSESTDWAALDQAMLDYCARDVAVTAKLWARELSKMEEIGLPPQALQAEHDFAAYLARQVRAGVKFDAASADKLVAALQTSRARLNDQLRRAIPDFKRIHVTPVRKIEKTKIVPFNPASTDHLAAALTRAYGWKPEVFTPSGKPQVDEDILRNLPYPEAAVMLEHRQLDKLLSKIAETKGKGKPWLSCVRRDGRIHGRMKPIGTITHRCAHADPNLGNIPKGEDKWGPECRALFIAEPGHSLVGWDMKGVQLRGLAHYLAAYDGGRYVEIVTKEDPHSANQGALELPPGKEGRDIAKRWVYAWLFGAGPNKLASVAGCSVKVAKAMMKAFYRNTPGLERVKNSTVRAHRNGRSIPGLDGRRIPTRSDHSAMSTLLQGFEAVVMRWATVLFGRRMDLLVPGRWEPVLHVHDEAVVETWDEEATQVAMMEGPAAVREIGRLFQSRCPLDGDVKAGASWRETH